MQQISAVNYLERHQIKKWGTQGSYRLRAQKGRMIKDGQVFYQLYKASLTNEWLSWNRSVNLSSLLGVGSAPERTRGCCWSLEPRLPIMRDRQSPSR